jgi:thiol-disulfide isomerase/thioredoxin
MSVELNQPAPELHVDHWVQCEPITLADLKGKVVLVEVFQVNCPGCFLYGLPEVIRLHDLYHEQGLVVLALATAFEDYEVNTLDNLQALVKSAAVTGETQKALEQSGELVDGKYRWNIPFAVGMDRVVADDEPVTEKKVREYAKRSHPDLDERRSEEQDYILKMIEQYLKNKTMKAETFELYNLKGTPSSILIDREGILRHVSLGETDELEPLIKQYLD